MKKNVKLDKVKIFRDQDYSSKTEGYQINEDQSTTPQDDLMSKKRADFELKC